MPDVEITVGGRLFDVACAEGEEHFLLSAAQMLDSEASVLVQQTGRIPEVRMLLMAGLMLADRTAGVEDKLRDAEETVARLTAEVEALKNRPAPPPERIEVAVVPQRVTDTLAELAARAESVAGRIEERTGES